MKTVDRCIACGGAIATQAHGMAAPFLARRIWDRSAFPVSLMRCNECGFGFFNPRLEPAEEQRLYAGYRTPEYLQMRHAVEPWYTKRLNASLSDMQFMSARRRRLAQLLDAHLPGRPIRTVLDFGGSTGALVHDLRPDTQAFVFDISGVDPVPGVTPLRSMDACRAHRFDVIVNSNVIEHVGSPTTLLQEIRGLASPQTAVFLEVPFESPLDGRLRLRRLAQLMILLAVRPSVGWSLFGPRGLCLMHEHINFFDARSVRALVEGCGGHVIAQDAYTWDVPPGRCTMGWCLASFS